MIVTWIKWIFAGAVGGWFCGFVILSIAAFIGKSGSTGTEYVGYWSAAYIILSIFYGLPLGVICLCLCRLVFFRASDESLFANKGKLAFATILGGVLGCLINLFIAALMGVFAFICTFTWIYFSTKRNQELK